MTYVGIAFVAFGVWLILGALLDQPGADCPMPPTFTDPRDFHAALCCTDASIFVDCFELIFAGLLFGI